MVHPRPQTPQGESVAKPETPLLIILSIACKWGPWQHVQSVIQKAKSVDKNILGRWSKIETASQTQKSIHNKQRQSTSGIGQPVPGKGRPPQAIPSPISRHIITCYVRYQGSKHTVIYILVQTIISVQAKLEVVRRKHIVHLIGFGAFLVNNLPKSFRFTSLSLWQSLISCSSN